MKSTSLKTLSRRALLIPQNREHPLYAFSLKASEILQIAQISRISRNETELVGYQRDEVRRHIQDIQDYLDSDSVIFPNPIILAFHSSVKFSPSRGPRKDDGVGVMGTLDIPLPEEGQRSPAWIVDGQQRAIAFSRTRNGDLPVPVLGFVGQEVAVQRDQFLRINNSRPLPNRLITELLPEIDTQLPAGLAARKIPSALCDILNNHPESPFQKIISRPSLGKIPSAIVNDTAVVDMIKDRLQNGCLAPYRNVATGEIDDEVILRLLTAYWNAVREVFPDAWGKPPSRSRLMHGAGIKAMGGLMDLVMATVDPSREDLEAYAATELDRIEAICRWTAGNWEGLGGLHWREIENTPRSVKLLTNHLKREYTLALHRS